MEMLFELLARIAPIPDGLREYLESILKRQEVGKKTILLNHGQIAKNIYFIEKGLIRGFRYDKNKECTSWLMREMDIIVSVRSFFRQMSSNEIIEILEDAIIYSITYEQLHYAYKTFPAFNEHRAILA